MKSADYTGAYRALWTAEGLAGVSHQRSAAEPRRFGVPAMWTAWLLMEKAGVPQAIIADVSSADPASLRRRLTVARAMMMFPPYAARIEALMRDMPRYSAKEVPCVAQAG